MGRVELEQEEGYISDDSSFYGTEYIYSLLFIQTKQSNKPAQIN
jgi:hypothetical protein